MKLVAERPKSLTKKDSIYCPGCTHGIVHRLIAEVMDELGIREKTIMVAPVGCSVFAYEYFNCDGLQASHGRAPAVATGLRRALPEDRIIFTYQGDGDLAAIGTAEIVHAATRGELITTIFINNAIYGMTGGQMAPTTIIGQVTDTTPYGRSAEYSGNPVKICEMLSQLDGPSYIARVTVNNPKNVRRAKKAIMRAFSDQIARRGFTLVEVLSSCPSNWGMSPLDALNWIEEKMLPVFPLGVYKDTEVKLAQGSEE
ncbi:MAG: 2-oxoglutarate oxidoreductase [Candidatus Eremiobacteraeota bacterium]|nr:2-oxoglutarate oxidoreductase [Candidatus Eremiobacteraeota bacterium]